MLMKRAGSLEAAQGTPHGLLVLETDSGATREPGAWRPHRGPPTAPRCWRQTVALQLAP